MLVSDNAKKRLYTYKVAYDHGTAPNPYGGVCTLAICKPRIRSTAKIGDIILGAGCRADSDRIVYCMVVDEVLSWADYFKRCQTDSNLQIKTPRSAKDRGDCIWSNDHNKYELLCNGAASGHGMDNFSDDVVKGKNVLISRHFWYFGKGEQFDIRLPSELTHIIPRSQGHRSASNQPYIEKFLAFFNTMLKEKGIGCGKLGEPNIPNNDCLKGCTKLPLCR